MSKLQLDSAGLFHLWARIKELVDTKADKATLLSGYSITDAYTKDEVDTKLGTKVDKVDGKQLSTKDFTTLYKAKLDEIETGAEVNIIESVEVNGIAATIADKKASVTIEIPEYTAMTNDEIDEIINA